jgi:hypothetical protein
MSWQSERSHPTTERCSLDFILKLADVFGAHRGRTGRQLNNVEAIDDPRLQGYVQPAAHELGNRFAYGYVPAFRVRLGLSEDIIVE